jgi:MobA/MobL family.
MSYYRLEAKIIGRSGGKSSVAAAAYRSAEKLHDKRIDKTFDYTRKQGVERSLILAPAGSADWVFDREKLWNEVEAREDRQNNHATAQLAREVAIDFPRALNKEQREALAIKFVQNEFVNKGMIADVSFHNTKASDGGEKPHAHIMLTMRDFDGQEFGNKNRSWNTAVFTKDDMIKDKSELIGLRGRYADYVNEALSDSGSNVRVSHLTNAENGKEIKHEYQPIEVYQMQQRGKYNQSFFDRLNAKADTIENYRASLKTVRAKGSKLGVEDYEYAKARRSVEVDTRLNISAPAIARPSSLVDTPTVAAPSWFNRMQQQRIALDNDQGLEI